MNRLYTWCGAVMLAAPLAVEVCRIANRCFDVWFIAQVRKAWAGFDGTLLMR